VAKPEPRNRNKSVNPSTPSKKFVGLNKDILQGIVISEWLPLPTSQQFDTLYEALYEAVMVYGGGNTPMVKKALRKEEFLKSLFEEAFVF
jgi:hypothetical protein